MADEIKTAPTPERCQGITKLSEVNMQQNQTEVKENLSTWFPKKLSNTRIIAICFTNQERWVLWRGIIEGWSVIPRHVHIDWQNLNGVVRITV